MGEQFGSERPHGGSTQRMVLATDDSPQTPQRSINADTVEADETHFLDYVRVLYRRRATVVTAFAVIVLTTAVYTFTATRIYEARVQILIEKENANVVTFKEAFEQNQVADDYYQTQYRILQSRALARRTLETLGLWNHPQSDRGSNGAKGIASVILLPIRSILDWLRKDSNELRLADETAAQSGAIDAFLAHLRVAPIRNSRLVDVYFSSPDPMLAAKIANALAQGYIQQNLEYRFNSSKEASEWLNGQLAEQRKHVEASEQAVQRYREQGDAASLGDSQNIVVQKLADVNAAVTRAKTERIQKEAAFNQIRTLQNDRASLDTFPAILSSTFIQQQKGELANLQRQQAQLSEKLGPRHPEMVKLGLAIQTAEAKIRGEISKVVDAMRNDYEQALAQEKSLTTALEQQKRDALALNRKGIEYGVLTRNAASNRQIFEALLQRTKETGISGELKTSNIRVVDPAETPRRPVRPNTANNLLLAIFGGAAFAIGLAFFFEYLDSRIKSPDELKQHLGLPFLGMIPGISDEAIDNPLISNGVPSGFSESFRGVRTNLLFSSADEGCRCLIVTSTGPGEGKTLVSGNLAIALAQAGQKVLLLDADMRKPRLHEVFGETQAPGLSNVLVGNAKSPDAFHKTTIPGLFLMPAGVQPPNPAELLGSKRFQDLLGSLAQHFEWIVVDTPPVMAVTDSAVVAHLATGVLFVVGAEMTSRHTAKRAIEQLVHARAKFVGAVLNRVDLEHNGYYYAQYYRREYADYYQQNPRT